MKKSINFASLKHFHGVKNDFHVVKNYFQGMKIN